TGIDKFFFNHLVLSLISSFFNFNFPHSDLHSSPTRRSSDLGGYMPARMWPWSLAPTPHSRPPRKKDSVLGNIPSGRAARRYISQDRKSTRLNSSHQIISYAVFCLKKKNLPPSTSAHWTTSSA